MYRQDTYHKYIYLGLKFDCFMAWKTHFYGTVVIIRNNWWLAILASTSSVKIIRLYKAEELKSLENVCTLIRSDMEGLANLIIFGCFFLNLMKTIFFSSNASVGQQITVSFQQLWEKLSKLRIIVKPFIIDVIWDIERPRKIKTSS